MIREGAAKVSATNGFLPVLSEVGFTETASWSLFDGASDLLQVSEFD